MTSSKELYLEYTEEQIKALREEAQKRARQQRSLFAETNLAFARGQQRFDSTRPNTNKK
jgi:hypothetical protein